VLDVDYHHGNGTQQIFYRRDDVQYVSLHGDPARAYPYLSGFADETGAGRGAGTNLNVPLAAGTDDDAYLAALGSALDAIAAFDPDVLIVSLGVDTFHNDPISDLAVTTEGIPRTGRAGRAARPADGDPAGRRLRRGRHRRQRPRLPPRRVNWGLTPVDTIAQIRPFDSNHSLATASDSRNSMSVSVFHASRSSVVIIALSSLMSATSWSP
jgi:hypothetical protein